MYQRYLPWFAAKALRISIRLLSWSKTEVLVNCSQSQSSSADSPCNAEGGMTEISILRITQQDRRKSAHDHVYIATWPTKVGLWPYKPMVKKGSCFDWDFSLDATQNETKATSDARV